ncbi:MAG: SpoIIE family protein phosphatase [candidate division Zixibacteria bacterium]|nr:SpoIIE family protein phosphatase [candidate division Zixibacteria bacterium]MCI0595907.1 SpoIIE family protein phosphatase [candidate division Zixibacteria bacterium]
MNEELQTDIGQPSLKKAVERLGLLHQARNYRETARIFLEIFWDYYSPEDIWGAIVPQAKGGLALAGWDFDKKELFWKNLSPELREALRPLLSNTFSEPEKAPPELALELDRWGCPKTLKEAGLPLIPVSGSAGNAGFLVGSFSDLAAASPASLERLFLTLFGLQLEGNRKEEQLKSEQLGRELLYQTGKVLASSLELSEVLEVIMDALKVLIPYDAAGVFLIDKRRQEVEEIATRGYDPSLESDLKLKIGQGLIGWVAKTGQPVIVPDVRQDSRYVTAKVTTRSEMVVPITSSERVIGVFNLESDQPDAFREEGLRLLADFAAQAALSIERAQLFAERVEKRRLEGELSIARRIQHSFFPKNIPALAGFDLFGANRPSSEVGGDYYDFIPIVENQVGIAIADVSGKGIPAALIMAAFRASLKAEIRNNYAIRTIMAKVNSLMQESIEAGNYVTAFYGVLDAQKKIFTFCNAGHNPPLILKADGTREYLTKGGVALGIFGDSAYKEKPYALREGDILVFYTDGVTEARNEAEEEFALPRLEKIVAENRGLPAEEIYRAVEGAVIRFQNYRRQDDFTLIVLKVL